MKANNAPTSQSVRDFRRLATVMRVVLACTPVILLLIQWFVIGGQASEAIEYQASSGLLLDSPTAPTTSVVSLYMVGEDGENIDAEKAATIMDVGQLQRLGYFSTLWLYVVENLQTIPWDTIQCYFDGQWLFYYEVLGPANPNQEDYQPTEMIVANMSPQWVQATQSFVFYAGVAIWAALGLDRLARRYAKQAEETERTTREFFANASHELKTPLTAIEGYVDGMAAGVIAPEDAQPVVEREVGRVKGLVNQILSLSKADAGAQKAASEPVDLREVVTDALADVAPEADKRGLALAVDLPEALPLVSDEALLYGIVSNLLSNAVRHAESAVRVTAVRDGDVARVTVANNGELLSDEALTHLFDRFYSGSGGNTGIGLALALEHAKLVGGTLTAAQEDGCTVLTLEVPASH